MSFSTYCKGDIPLSVLLGVYAVAIPEDGPRAVTEIVGDHATLRDRIGNAFLAAGKDAVPIGVAMLPIRAPGASDPNAVQAVFAGLTVDERVFLLSPPAAAAFAANLRDAAFGIDDDTAGHVAQQLEAVAAMGPDNDTGATVQ